MQQTRGLKTTSFEQTHGSERNVSQMLCHEEKACRLIDQQALSMGGFTDQEIPKMLGETRAYQRLKHEPWDSGANLRWSTYQDSPWTEGKGTLGSHVADFVPSTYDTIWNCRCGHMRQPRGPIWSFNKSPGNFDRRRERENKLAHFSVKEYLVITDTAKCQDTLV